MSNTIVVCSPKPAITGKRLINLAEERNLSLRFLAMGGYLPGDPSSYTRSLRLVSGGAIFVVGAFESDRVAVARFDDCFERGDRISIAKMLNDCELPWIELYTGDFDYRKHLKKFPKDKDNLSSTVSNKDLPRLRDARTRYFVFNQSGSKPGDILMNSLAELSAEATLGIFAKDRKTKR